MLEIKYYEILSKSNTFQVFLHKILIQLKIDFKKYNLSNGFVAFLDESKINERFNIITSIGRFRNKDNINLVSAKEIDILSIVYISKNSYFKGNTFIDIIQKYDQDIYLYLEFENELQEDDKKELEIFFSHLNDMIIKKEWGFE